MSSQVKPDGQAPLVRNNVTNSPELPQAKLDGQAQLVINNVTNSPKLPLTKLDGQAPLARNNVTNSPKPPLAKLDGQAPLVIINNNSPKPSLSTVSAINNTILSGTPGVTLALTTNVSGARFQTLCMSSNTADILKNEQGRRICADGMGGYFAYDERSGSASLIYDERKKVMCY
ncbi:MAG: hypothetical protein LBE20_06965, partial [Deltaproteobacteria bacterium]|nr:hypothetical protein [Deltaproteobacteria bacterium]